MTLMKTLGFNDQSYRQMSSVQWPINKNHVVCDVMPMVLCVVCVYWVANRNILFCDVMPMVYSEEYRYNGGLKRYLINVLVSASILKLSTFNMWVKKKDSFVALCKFLLGFYRQYISQSRFFHRLFSCHVQCNRIVYRAL